MQDAADSEEKQAGQGSQPDTGTRGGAKTAAALPIAVRAARPEDAARIGAILAEAFPAMYYATFGRMPLPRIAALLHALYDAQSLGLATTLLAEQDGRVVGLAIMHVGESIGKGTAGDFWRATRGQLGAWRGMRAFAGGLITNRFLSKRIPHAPDLAYIEALAVAADARGQGVGTRLLAEAEVWTRARGRQRLALHVLQSNLGARRLYERAGYRLHAPEPRPAPSGGRRAWISLLMFRDLPAVSAEPDARPDESQQTS